MSDEGSNAEWQEELESLKYIFSSELRCDESGAVITLFPLHDGSRQEIHAQIDLHVRPSKSYPKQPPVIHLDKSKGLSNVKIQSLQTELEELANKIKGEVMVYQLALHVQEFLLANNKPGNKSFYDEMVFRKTQQELKKYEIEEDKKIKKIQDVREKFLQKAALMADEEGSSDEGEDSKQSPESVIRSVRSQSFCNGNSSEEINSLCEHNCCKYINFSNKVLRGRCIDHDKNSILYCAIDNISGKLLTIREWILKPKEKQPEIFSQVQKQLDRLQQELNYLKKFDHINIISYIEFKSIIEKNECVVYVLQEYVSNINLDIFISKHLKLEINVIRYFIIGILNALIFLHNNSIVHRDLNGSSVYLSKSGTIKVGDHSIKKRMDDIYNSYHNGFSSESKDKAGPKSDIQQLGHILLSLMGVTYAQEEIVVVPDYLPPDLKDLIEKCLIENEEKRWGAKQLIEHKFVKNPLPKQIKFKRNFPDAKRNSESNAEEDSEDEDSQLLDSIPKDLKRQSRLLNDFEILKEIGSGSFGKVLKARNNLDGNIYAIKVIDLNPRSKQLNRKIIREVQLLSKLNHENVVRYYNSWIETRDKDDSSTITKVTTTPLQTLTGKQSFKLFDGDTNLTALKSGGSRKSDLDNEDDYEDEDDEDDDDDDDDDDEEDEDESFENGKIVSDGDSIIFKKDSMRESENCESEESDVIDICKEKTMYIQMEFCEKNTLRKAIDKDCLYEDQSRSWRLFREIVEGLSYIHEQDMIHRDLKPVNIFLDLYDHVKIGDFGLATSVIHKDITGIITGFGDCEPPVHTLYEGSHTGGVGTSIYIAPELTKPFGKLHYNQKVDIYSLGIIFFEMCHSPFTTNMEKSKITSNLRLPEVLIPHALEKKMPKQMELVKMLLNHDPKLRPSCQEILEGDFLPPPLIEDEEVQEFVKNTLSNPQSKAYKYLISSCFEQKTAIEDDVSYHLENTRSEKLHILQEIAKERIEKILKKHGAVYLPTPLLLPKSDIYANVEACVKLMTHSGSIVNLPYDLRVPFARYVASKDVKRLRRYAVDRVYREKKIHGFHPKELYECVFDIVTPTPGDLVADSEMLSVLNEIVSQLPSLRNRNCFIRLNHTFLLKAVLLHFKVEKWYSEIFKILIDAKDNKLSRSKLETDLMIIRELGEQNVNTLASLFLKEDSIQKISLEFFKIVSNKREEAVNVAKNGFQQLKSIISNAECLGINIPIKVTLGMVYNIEHCSGVMFDLVCQTKLKKKKDGVDVLASGCRYDSLLLKFRKLFEMTGRFPKDVNQSAVGMSISLDKIACVLKEDNALSENVIICSLGQNAMVKEKAELVKSLWASEIKCSIEENIDTLEELLAFSEENKVTHVITLKETDRKIVRVWSWEKDKERYQERKVGLQEVTDHIIRYSKSSSDYVEGNIQRQESKTSNSESSSVSLKFNIHIIPEDKMSANMRRKYEIQIRSKISAVLEYFSSRPNIEIVGVFVDAFTGKSLALNFDYDEDSKDYSKNVQSIIDRSPKKKYLQKVCDKIKSFYGDKSNVVVILYSIHDDEFTYIIKS